MFFFPTPSRKGKFKNFSLLTTSQSSVWLFHREPLNLIRAINTLSTMSFLPEQSNVSMLSKNEQKAKELISKLGLKPLPGISRVTFRKKDNQIIAIDHPEVYRTAGGNYVVFGEPKVDNFTQKLAAAQQQAQTTDVAPAAGDVSNSPDAIQADMQAAAESSAPASKIEDTEDLDAGDLAADDIDLVVEQANVSKGQAIKALKEHNGDIVNAIMSLSK